MKRINETTVELTKEEQMASTFLEDLLDDGIATPRAVKHVREIYPDLDEAFYEYLRE